MLQDLVASAVNAALQKAQHMVQEELQRVAGQTVFQVAPMPGPTKSG